MTTQEDVVAGVLVIDRKDGRPDGEEWAENYQQLPGRRESH